LVDVNIFVSVISVERREFNLRGGEEEEEVIKTNFGWAGVNMCWGSSVCSLSSFVLKYGFNRGTKF